MQLTSKEKHVFKNCLDNGAKDMLLVLDCLNNGTDPSRDLLGTLIVNLELSLKYAKR